MIGVCPGIDPPLTVARLREVLSYDAKSGLFEWNFYRGGRAGRNGKPGHLNDQGYVIISIDRRRYRAHRLAWLYTHGAWPDEDIDHINRDRTDNRLANLRPVTRSQNLQNMSLRSDNASGFKGVYLDKHGMKWCAEIKAGGRRIKLGRFGTARSAADAYDRAAAEHFGAFACLNGAAA